MTIPGTGDTADKGAAHGAGGDAGGGAHGPAHGDGGHDDLVHEVPFDPWVIFFALVGLTAVSWLTDLMHMAAKPTGVVVLTVALCKASLVTLYFMHLKYEARWKWFLLIPPLVVAVILALVLTPDVGHRHLPWL